MTAQEALEIVTNVIQSSEMTKETDMACAIAQKALEKQTPKKPIKFKAEQDIKFGVGIWKAGTNVYKCPCCNCFISRSNDYCNKCGQAIDWSYD